MPEEARRADSDRAGAATSDRPRPAASERASSSVAGQLRRAVRAFGLLNLEQKAAAIGALLLVVSTFGTFSFVEAAEILIGLGVLALLLGRAEGKRFHLPFGDGTMIAAAGIWAGALIVVRLFDRPLGQNLLALACAAILFLAGARERAKRPADDLPAEQTTPPTPDEEPWPGAAPGAERAGDRRPKEAARSRARPEPDAAGAGESSPPGDPTQPLEEATEPLPPPEFEPYRARAGEQLQLAEESDDEPAAPPPSDQPDDG
jgi:hypothetical protein